MNIMRKNVHRRLDELQRDIDSGSKGVGKIPKNSPQWAKGVTWLSNFQRTVDCLREWEAHVPADQLEKGLAILEGTGDDEEDDGDRVGDIPNEPGSMPGKDFVPDDARLFSEDEIRNGIESGEVAPETALILEDDPRPIPPWWKRLFG